MSIVLDRDRRYGLVYGDPVEKYYQDSCFFDGTGKLTRSATRNRPEIKPESEPVHVVAQADDKAARIIRLQKMTVPALKDLAAKVETATGEALPAGGRGAKARLVKYIADRTTD